MGSTLSLFVICLQWLLPKIFLLFLLQNSCGWSWTVEDKDKEINKFLSPCAFVYLSSSIFLAILFVHSFLCSSFASLFRTFALIFLFSEVPLSSLVKILHGLITSVRKAQWYYKHIAAWRRTLCNKTSSCSTGSCSNIILDAVCPVNPQAL